MGEFKAMRQRARAWCEPGLKAWINGSLQTGLCNKNSRQIIPFCRKERKHHWPWLNQKNAAKRTQGEPMESTSHNDMQHTKTHKRARLYTRLIYRLTILAFYSLHCDSSAPTCGAVFVWLYRATVADKEWQKGWVWLRGTSRCEPVQSLISSSDV